MQQLRLSLSRLSLCLLGLLASTLTAASASDAEEARVLGWVEKAIVMPVGATVKVKLDSGALTSSMHATAIELRDRDGEDWVEFELELEDAASGEQLLTPMALPVERFILVRGAGGDDRRPVVRLDLCIGDQIHSEQFSLRDRGEMIYPVLIGRRTLQDLGLVDVNSTYLTRPSCEPGDDAEASAA
ncbi:RimK/LysX family protein [Haliea sp. E1-2-M8]|uniref:retropepsin-like aspartic peptidase RloA3 n=1 Tax=Haliea sp. E1-2-M8 TaxID=3064706 RepID=UPI00271751F5|nr:RimK/LysX family protein [Haliea sp. E1-2-M8]MDO8863394.1 RimK/LysX family protein [Haliea sp. E1-2-M8]